MGHLGRTEESLDAYAHSISMDPGHAAAFNNRGYMYTTVNRWEEALSDPDKAIALDPDNGYVYRNLGIYYIGKGDAQQALENLEKAPDQLNFANSTVSSSSARFASYKCL